MANWLVAELKRLGAEVEKAELGDQQIEGQTLPLPPLVLGKIGFDSTKKTVCVYGASDL